MGLQQVDGFDKRATPIATIEPQVASGNFNRIEQVIGELLADRLFPFPRSAVFFLFKLKLL